MSVLARNKTDPNCIVSNLNSLISGGGGRKKNDNNEVDSKIVEEEFCLGLEVGLDGPQHSTNTNLSITGGVSSNRLGQHDEDGPILSINSLNPAKSFNEDRRKQMGGVYSDCPRIVYNKLTQEGPIKLTVSCPNLHPQETSEIVKKHIHPVPANVRRQNQIIHKYNLGKPLNSFTKPTGDSVSQVSETPSSRAMTEQAGVIRNLPTRSRHMNKPANSLSSAGTILCCSSIGSSDIRNCNSRFIENHEITSAVKVWKGAAELGVEGAEEDEQYVERIRINEKKKKKLVD
jgi:hypothetical protein